MQAGLEERKKKIKKIKRKRGSIQGFAWPNRNVSRERAWRLWRRGKLKGREKKCWSLQVLHEKTESLKATHLPALPFCSNGYLSNFLPSCLPFHTVYKYWKNLPASVEVSLHLNSFFWVQNFYALFILIRYPFFSFVCVYVYIRRASLAYHWCVCEIAWMSFQK